MTPSQAFDPAEFKRNIRTEWRSAAAGWRRWLEVVEAEDGGKRHSARLVEIAELQPGVSVLDVGGGYGEPSLTAAPRGGSTGAGRLHRYLARDARGGPRASRRGRPCERRVR